MKKLFHPSLTKPQLEKEFKKLRKLKYNQFRWWRMYDNPVKPLDKRTPLRDRIMNGDFDFSHYSYQAQWCEHEINEIWDKHYPDIGKFNEETSLLRTRRTRLLEDFEKDEKEKLTLLIKEFTNNFRCNKKQVEEEMLGCVGDLIDLYYIIADKYKIIFTPSPLKRRGRPKKTI
jgi:hypothetical protein